MTGGRRFLRKSMCSMYCEKESAANSSEILGINNSFVSTASLAQNSIESFKSALSYVSTERSRMGAYQNSIEHTIRNLDNVVENTTPAESRIRDTDMAREMMEFSTANILAQAYHIINNKRFFGI